ncbi:MAG: molybdopterin-dependent oxidoreductase [Acidimicrobiales bacterium]
MTATSRWRPGVLVPAVARRFTSPLHDEQVAARLGVALGVLFSTCALTGAYSYVVQHEPAWLTVPSRPAGLYRITQGVHVVTGFATIPVLLAKLWVVAPKLVTWPAVRSAGHALERLLLLPLVGGAIFLLLSGVANVARWYPWTFFFPQAHRWAAWVTMGALTVHVGATWATSRRALAPAPVPPQRRRDRRTFLGGVAASSGVLAVAAAGGTVPFVSPVSFLAQRRPGVGPQGIPVNKTAGQAGVVEAASDPAWRLTVGGAVARPLTLSLADLRAMAQREAVLPIACVEGWSASARWRGVAVRDLLDEAGAVDGAEVTVTSLQEGGLYGSAEVNHLHARDPDLLLALEIDGEPLHLDHGFPARLIGPNRPGVAQTKWVTHLEVR